MDGYNELQLVSTCLEHKVCTMFTALTASVNSNKNLLQCYKENSPFCPIQKSLTLVADRLYSVVRNMLVCLNTRRFNKQRLSYNKSLLHRFGKSMSATLIMATEFVNRI
jgi:hypothetical protein